MANWPVDWHEGLFLRPHHFQAAQRHWTHLADPGHRLQAPPPIIGVPVGCFDDGRPATIMARVASIFLGPSLERARPWERRPASSTQAALVGLQCHVLVVLAVLPAG